ncbi:MAG: adenosylcobalamin-dependent ribonucleoside-diphosphate reductase [Steroidobacterales bacterium]
MNSLSATSQQDAANARLARFIWETRYRDAQARPPEAGIEDTWKRVAGAVAAIESEPQVWQERFLEVLRDYRFLPGGRILAGAGTSRRVTLFNCFVMGAIEDSIEGIFDALKEGALTMQQGGGVGYDFSTLRPHGTRAATSGMIASGPVSFMHIWDAMCATILSTGARRGAMMATLRCDHPDIEEFIGAKRLPGVLQHFNLSVLVTDAFMQAVRRDAEWPLVFPDRNRLDDAGPDSYRLQRAWSASDVPVACRVYKTTRARALWARLCEAAYDSAEPGVLFIDRINGMNNLGYCETLSATNPCAEEPLPHYGACNLGSINLTAFVVGGFTPLAHLAEDAIRDTVRIAVRMLDNVIDISRFPVARQQQQVALSRRVGIGITGLADALAMLGLRYDSAPARRLAAHTMQLIRDEAYQASIDLAAQRGAFPALDVERYLARPFLLTLPAAMRAAIRRQGIRNSHLTAIAPAGTISLLAHNVSSGIEPFYGIESLRRVLDADGNEHHFQTTDHAYALWRAQQDQARPLPDAFIDADRIAAVDQLAMQAALQPYIDGAISKTITLAADVPRGDAAGILEAAFDLGLKGCTLFRTQARPGVIDRRDDIHARQQAVPAEAYCGADRECD